MSIAELLKECRAWGPSDEGYRDLHANLKEHLGGIQMVEAMLVNDLGT